MDTENDICAYRWVSHQQEVSRYLFPNLSTNLFTNLFANLFTNLFTNLFSYFFFFQETQSAMVTIVKLLITTKNPDVLDSSPMVVESDVADSRSHQITISLIEAKKMSKHCKYI